MQIAPAWNFSSGQDFFAFRLGSGVNHSAVTTVSHVKNTACLEGGKLSRMNFRGIAMTPVPMTLRGAEKLREELELLKSVRRPEIIRAIADAREHGDLKENAEYHAAREQQGFCEGRIQEIEAKLSNAQIIDVTKMSANGRVIFGSTVSILNLENEEELTYRIVGDDEADFKHNLISINSPMARGLVGKEEGDVALIRTPGGDVEYEIQKVEYL